MDIKDFPKWIKGVGASVPRNADRMVRKCAIAMDAALVLATPVDTGRARSNWQVNVDSPITSSREPYVPGDAGSTVGENSRAAQAQADHAIAAYKGGRPESAIFITNNLAYIGKLNEGSSPQAPAGFVEKAILVGVNAIKNDPLVEDVRVS